MNKLLLSFFVACHTIFSAMAATITVTQITDDGTGATSGSLSWAINTAAATGDVIAFNLTAGDVVTLNAALPDIDKSFTMEGINIATGNRVTIQVASPGVSTYRVFNILFSVGGKTITLNDLILRGGNVTGNGGVVWYNGGSLNMNRCVIRDGKASGGGGGIYSIDSMIMNQCTVTDNTAIGGGGGVYLYGTAISGTIINSTITANVTTTNGGGVYIGQGYACKIINTTISGNAGSGGGGVYAFNLTGSTLCLALNSIFINNTGNDFGTSRLAFSYGYYSWKSTGTAWKGANAAAPNIANGYNAGDLGSLGNNGGATPTMQLSATAPAYQTGGYAYYNATDGYYYKGTNGSYYKLATTVAAFTPVTANPETDKITTDQRGATRSATPSMGAYDGTIANPEIDLKQATTPIADGSGTYDFGNQATSTNTDVVFTIENTGTSTSTLGDFTITGTDASLFSFQGDNPTTVANGSSATFTVRFAPTSGGAKTATISFANQDENENPYNFTVTGTGIPTLTWDGSEGTDWNTAGNWNGNAVPTATDNAIVPSVGITNLSMVSQLPSTPAVCKDLTIQTGGTVTIAAGKALTVNGTLTNSAGTTGLVIKSDGTGTGSLKIVGTVSGEATIERNLSINNWHLISSPLASQPIINFLTNNVDIATSALASAPPYQFAMSGFSADSWTSFYQHDKTDVELFGVGKGYRVLTKDPFTKTTYFEGTLNSLPISTVSVETGWNLVGNPYTTALNINNGTTGFVSVNLALLPASNVAVYFWDGDEKAYVAVNDGSTDTNAPVGQGFFVKAASAGTITFNSDMQVHDGLPGFKAAALPRPTIKLIANNGTGNASTLVKFMDGAHEGLDVGYDAGIFKADADFSVYTKLVEDNGVEFQLQYLPTNQYNKMVIPIGIDCKAGGEIVLSVQTVQLDPTCKVILEDKLTNTFTDLSKGSYKAAIAADTKGADRFFLHTGDIISGLDDQSLADGKLTAYARGNKEIRVIGEVGEGAVATLVNGLGQVVLTKTLGAGSLNIIGLPNLSSGLYLLNIKDKDTAQTIKVMIRK